MQWVFASLACILLALNVSILLCFGPCVQSKLCAVNRNEGMCGISKADRKTEARSIVHLSRPLFCSQNLRRLHTHPQEKKLCMDTHRDTHWDTRSPHIIYRHPMKEVLLLSLKAGSTDKRKRRKLVQSGERAKVGIEALGPTGHGVKR